MGHPGGMQDNPVHHVLQHAQQRGDHADAHLLVRDAQVAGELLRRPFGHLALISGHVTVISGQRHHDVVSDGVVSELLLPGDKDAFNL